MNTIPIADIEFSKLSLTDNTGKVFYWNNRVFRAISPNAISAINELFDSGLIAELYRENLIPNTVQSDLHFEELDFVLEHERVPYQTYPFEWSFEMLRSAGLLVLKVSEIASKHGYMLNDCHPYNILFVGGNPLYVDIGSFFRPETTEDVSFSFPITEFMTRYIGPLTMWSQGNEFLARQSHAHIAYCGMSVDSYRNYKRIFFRRARCKHNNILRKCENFTQRVISKLIRYIPRKSIFDQLFVHMSGFFLVNKIDVLKMKLLSFDNYYESTQWSNYHEQYLSENELNCTPRFEKLLELVRRLDVSSVVDLAANQGVFSFLLAERTQVKRIACIDRDTKAVDELFLKLQKANYKTIIQPVLCDLITNPTLTAEPPVYVRVKGDLAIALAITHHLLLGQNIGLADVLRRISSYTNRYVIVEFMPLGLWNGQSAPPVPKHYNLEWFVNGFADFFNVLEVIELGVNRIAVVGELKHTGDTACNVAYVNQSGSQK